MWYNPDYIDWWNDYLHKSLTYTGHDPYEVHLEDWTCSIL